MKIFFSPSVIIFLGALIVAFGGLLAAWQNEVKNEEITRLNKYILSSVIGGDSYCLLALASINSVNNKALLSIISKGEYPLYEVSCRIVDLDEFDKIKGNITFENIMKSDTVINVGNISPNTARILSKVDLGSGNEKRYNIFISARNGFITQLIRLKKIDGEWKSAVRIERRDGDKEIVLEESIDKAFPRDKNGELNW